MTDRTDNFNRTDSALALGTPSDAGSDWVVGFGTWGISSNKGYRTADVAAWETVYLEASIADADVQVTMSTNGAFCGLCARWSANNSFLFAVVFSGTDLRFYKEVAGVDTQLGSTYSGTMSNGDVLKLTCNGNSLTVSQNGNSRITATDSFNNTATKHGLTAYLGSAKRYEDFSITSLAGAAGQPLIRRFGIAALSAKMGRGAVKYFRLALAAFVPAARAV